MPLCSLFQPTPDSATNPPDFGQSVLSHPEQLEFIRVWGIVNKLNRFQLISVNQPIHSFNKNSGWIEIPNENKGNVIREQRKTWSHYAYCMAVMFEPALYRCRFGATTFSLFSAALFIAETCFPQYCLNIYLWIEPSNCFEIWFHHEMLLDGNTALTHNAVF